MCYIGRTTLIAAYNNNDKEVEGGGSGSRCSLDCNVIMEVAMVVDDEEDEDEEGSGTRFHWFGPVGI